MSDSSEERLVQDRAFLRKSDQEARRTLTEALRQNRRRRDDLEKAAGPFLRHVCVILYVLTHHCHEAPVQFLQRHASRKHWEELPPEELRDIVERLFLVTPSEEIADLVDKNSPSDPAAMFVAAKESEAWLLQEWVKHVNEVHGIAPSTTNLLDRLSQRREDFGEGCRPPYLGTGFEVIGRVWTHRWRQQYHVKRGRIRSEDVMTVPEMADKASQGGANGTKTGTPKWVPFFDPSFMILLSRAPLLGAPRRTLFWCPV